MNTQDFSDKEYSLIPQDYKDIMQQVFDQSKQGFQVISKNWEYLYVNRAVAQQGKKTPNDLIGKKMTDVYPSIEETPLFEQMKKVMREKISIKMDNEFRFPDGSLGWFSLFIHPWSDGIIIFSVDVTERKKEEAKLLEKISKLDMSKFENSKTQQELEDIKNAIEKLIQPVIEAI